ncbi:transposase [Alkalihalobacillus deserti]|uniref:transposase n=1 Tax=Alkalihalobacillus deserti TaxID=2879466 RepID=UPI001D142380|nr:transposase [Alkalihalobacillus deserti]
MTSGSGLLLVKEFNEKVGLHDLIRSVQLKDHANHTEHTNDAVIMQKIYQNIGATTPKIMIIV